MSAPFRVPYMSRPSYRVQQRSSALDGVFFACLLNIGFLAVKDLGAPRWAVICYFSFTAVPMVFAPVFAATLARWDRKRLFWTAAMVGRLSFIGVAFWNHWALLLATGVLAWSVMPVILPAYNVYWQANYPGHVRGRILGRMSLLRGAMAAGCFFAFGELLHFDPELRRAIFPFGGLCGALALGMIGHIRLRRRALAVGRPLAAAFRGWRRAFRPWRSAIQILRNHPTFAWYEAAFMLYGFGFMLCNFLRDDHFARGLRLPHDTFGVFMTIAQLVMPFAAPLWGICFDHLRAAWTAALGCVLLACYALTLALAQSSMGVYGAGALFGAAMAGIQLCWQLGAVEFAGREDAGPFTAVHAAFVGVRAALTLPLALFLELQFTGDARPAFWTAFGFFCSAVLLHWWVGRRQRREQPAAGLPAPKAAGALAGVIE